MNNKRNVRLKVVEEMAKAWCCTPAEAVCDILYDFYESAGFRREQLEQEFGSMTDEEMVEVYCNL